MSEPCTSAMELEATAARWLERRDREDWSQDDQAKLDAWLEAPAQRLAYLRLYAAWNYADRLAALRRAGAERPPSRKPSNVLIVQIAAAALAVALLGAFAARFVERPKLRTYETAIGAHELVSFADGSKIELNTNTTIRTRMTTGQRTVWLDRGEAYFQVRHDPAHPFTVIAGNRRVTDLGTDFLVRRDEARLEVAVVRGAVRYDAARRTAMLKPGDVVTASGNAMSQKKEPLRQLLRQLSWRRGVLVFDNTTLADAAEEFNRYNREKLIVTDPAAAKLTIGGTFPAGDVSAFTDVAQDVLGLRVERRGSDIVISH
jgi:transmembrane sensor